QLAFGAPILEAVVPRFDGAWPASVAPPIEDAFQPALGVGGRYANGFRGGINGRARSPGFGGRHPDLPAVWAGGLVMAVERSPQRYERHEQKLASLRFFQSCQQVERSDSRDFVVFELEAVAELRETGVESLLERL